LLAVTLALAWNSELLAILGLVAVVVAPLAVEGKLTGLGLGASLIGAAAALGIGQARLWRTLGGLTFGLALAQIAVYVVEARKQAVFDEVSGLQDAWHHRGTAGLLGFLTFALAL